MPKRPVKDARVLTIPQDLGEGSVPQCALRTKNGEVYCDDVLHFLNEREPGTVDLVVADPPYGIGKDSWDEFSSEAAYIDWCDAWLSQVQRILTPTGSGFVFGFSEILAEVKARSAKRFSECRWLIWHYRNKANLGRDFGRSHESILHLRMPDFLGIDVDAIRIPYNDHTKKYPERSQATSSHFHRTATSHDNDQLGSSKAQAWQPHPLGAKPRDVFEVPILCNGMAEKTPHPTQKPESLIETLISSSSRPGQLVCDPFAGSGTTLAVAQRLERKFLGCEKDPRYVGLIRERLSSVSTPARLEMPSETVIC